ncbi:MAG: phosphoenolpyruvate--protein phosphotransferase [Peptostreptococcaceae bacterium]|nr:phosphoenolpyruvate--protein phosphotransferase [Peptostreptococcaceae bacterium]
MREYFGVPASPGAAYGKSVHCSAERFSLKEFPKTDARFEKRRLEKAIEDVCQDVRKSALFAREHLREEEACIFDAHLLMLEDPCLLSCLKEKIESGKNAFNAVLLSFDEEIRKIRRLENEYLRERAQDLKDVARRLLFKLEGKSKNLIDRLPSDAILLCDELFPSDIAGLNPAKIKGFITKYGAATGHVSIMARALGIPAIVGVADLPSESGLPLVMDGGLGSLVFFPDERTLSAYAARHANELREKDSFSSFASRRTVTACGNSLRLAANIGEESGVAEALAAGAEGVGLFRTEFLFMDRSAAPSEEEQYEVYSRVLSSFRKHRVVIRTLDIGGDKALPYLSLPKEPNPALGLRAMRYFIEQPQLIKPQLRALLRASVHGNLALMFPMIASWEELLSVKALLDLLRDELQREGASYAEKIEVGITIETPHSAVMAEAFVEDCDFFSIGTNDLTQYCLAADRLSSSLSSLCSSFQPGVLRLAAQAVRAAKQNGLWTSVCGESGFDLSLLPFWIGLGLDELSMPPSMIPKIRALIARLDKNSLHGFAEEVLKAKSKTQVQALLKL